MAITEDYISIETAKLLKDKGFNEETEYVFSNNGELLKLSHLGIKDLTNTDCNDYHTWQFPIEGVASIISAPTLQMATKWLRKTYNICVVSFPVVTDDDGEAGCLWNYVILKKLKTLHNSDSIYESSEFALSNGLKYALENLI